MQTLTKQEEFDDEDEWNPCKAAGVCLMLLSTCCEDDIVQHVLPFVKVRLSRANNFEKANKKSLTALI